MEVDDGATATQDDDDDDQQLPDSTVQTFAERELTLAQSKQIIALLCTAIIEAPETNVRVLNVSSLGGIHMCSVECPKC